MVLDLITIISIVVTLAWIAGIDLDSVGYVVVAVFVVTWLIALAVWRLARIEQRWAAQANTGLESP